MNRKVSGFSLIEMAIVLVIIGLVGSIALPGLKVMVNRQKISTTAERQEKILYALASYALLNGSLPNAASPMHLSGEEDKAHQLCRGVVPYATLDLPESFAKEGYHHWFTYVVEKKYTEVPSGTPLTQNPIQHEQSFCRLVKNPDKPSETQPVKQQTIPQPALKISINDGHQVVSVAVAVISHGPEGRGAPNSLTPPHEGDEKKIQKARYLSIAPSARIRKIPFPTRLCGSLPEISWACMATRLAPLSFPRTLSKALPENNL
jgi:prepilin-type N-terminal cleavage/methylation domain-containing protein